MRLRLIDGHCPSPYAPGDLLTRAMGGTEASVLHLAEGLAARGVEVIVHQHNRTAVARHGATYAPLGDPGAVADADPQARVIVVNAAKIALLWARRQPCARVLLWRHNFVGARTAALGPALSQAGVRIVCVSCFHADHTAGRLCWWTITSTPRPASPSARCRTLASVPPIARVRRSPGA